STRTGAATFAHRSPWRTTTAPSAPPSPSKAPKTTTKPAPTGACSPSSATDSTTGRTTDAAEAPGHGTTTKEDQTCDLRRTRGGHPRPGAPLPQGELRRP